MAWTGLVLTVEGRNALNQAQLSNTMNFKSIVVGDGKAPENFSTLKNLVHQLYEITAIKIDVTDGRCIVTADFPKVAYDYYFREIGIIVTTEDGDKLYVYDNCGDDAQYMVSSTGVETTKKRIRLSLAISNVEKITVSEPQILYVAYDDYENTVERLNTDIKNTEIKLQKEITAESDRAVKAEGKLTENLTAEVDRAVEAEGQLKKELDEEIKRAGEAETQLGEDIIAETDRATKAEKQLKEDITAEADRASGAEEELQRRKLDVDGDASNVTVKFSEAQALGTLKGIEKLSELFGMSAKAVSSLIVHLADKANPHGVTAKLLNLDKVTNTSDMDKPVSTAQQAALDALYQQMAAYARQLVADLVNGAPAALDTLKELADAITNHKSIMDALDAAIGKKANEAEFDSHVKDAKHITATERTNWNDANSKKHTHSNKTALDGITAAMIEAWNSAVTHISDGVKHITADERDKWNNNSSNYGTCSTAAATAAKVVACTGFKLATGAEVAVKFTATNTAANPTLNVNNTGAKAVYYRGSAIGAGNLAANRTYVFRYNGSQWDLVGDINTNTTYTAASAAPKAAGTAAVGTSAKYAREDHVHPLQTTVSGNAGTATKLATARKIGNASFNGTANITLAQIGAADRSIYGDTTVSYGREPGTAVGTSSFCWGLYDDGESILCNQAPGDQSVALGGYCNVASNTDAACVGGSDNTADAYDCGCFAGCNNVIQGNFSASLGGNGCTISERAGQSAIAGGSENAIYSPNAGIIAGSGNRASGDYSAVAGGYGVNSRYNQLATGHWNNDSLADNTSHSGTGTGTAFCVGNGTKNTGRSNAARIDYNGKMWCKAAYSAVGADYAELFEWEDGNPDNEDRRGHFVTLEGKKIRKAEPGDWVLGVVSGNPCILGNTDMEWQGQFLKDEFGAYLTEEFTETVKKTRTGIVEKEDGTTERVPVEYEEEISGTRYVLNPDYDPDMEYVDRISRPEWDAVGMMGVMSVRDNGTCEANGFCTVSDGGTAVWSKEGYRVIRRVNGHIVEIVFR